MKVIAFNGSARKDGNTAILVRAVFKELEKAGIRIRTCTTLGKESAGMHRMHEMQGESGPPVRD